MSSTVTLREMLEAGVHFGHQARYWNPKMEPFLFGQRNKINIINLERSLELYNEAINFAGKLAAKRKKIMFVGTKRAAQAVVREEAMRCGMPFVSRYWLGGLLTNYRTVKQSINRLKTLEAEEADGTWKKMSKKEQLRHKRMLEKLSRSLSGIKDMEGLPDALFVIDVDYENIAVSEAQKLNIPIIGIVDSNSNPDGIDYVVPGNDDAIRSIRLYARGVADAILDGALALAQIDAGKADEFVELDDAGAPVIREEPEQVVVKKKVVRKKKVVVKKTGVDKIASDGDASKAKQTKKKTATAAKKKVSKKKTTDKRTTTQNKDK